MKKILFALFVVFICFSAPVLAQIPTGVLVQIVKAEDELRFDKSLEALINSPNPQIQMRAILAAGRIGDERAVPILAEIVADLVNPEVNAMAAFALGEIESIKGADAILTALTDSKIGGKARTVEAAGKIAAANPKEEKSKGLAEAILKVLEDQLLDPKQQNREIILLGLTAVLRARPENGEITTAKFLTYSDGRIRADAANTLTRIRAKNANETLRKMLVSDDYAVARANAARALGAAEDKYAFDLLLNSAIDDEDSRVRVSAIRSLGNLKDKNAAEKLLERGEKLLTDYKKSKFANPTEKNELLEIATALGRILTNTNNEKAVKFLDDLRQADKYSSAETEIAVARIAPKVYADSIEEIPEDIFTKDWRTSSAAFLALGEIANLESNDKNNPTKLKVRLLLVQLIGIWVNTPAKDKATDNTRFAIPDLLRAFAAFKSENTSNILRPMLQTEPDPFIRVAVAEILADQPASKENVNALESAFIKAVILDKDYNDAQLAILDALFKLDKDQPDFDILITAVNSEDYLVRKKALEILKKLDRPIAREMIERSLAVKDDQLSPYSPAFGTKLGAILNTNADYTRAVSRKNRQTKAVLTTEKGTFTIDLLPEDAPLTVDNFIKLARSGYFNGLAVHRVVPNFVMQDGDPRGDGNGGPGWEIRCELNLLSYERGAVGMALSGKDTGGSQWFITHSPQPHLDGGYTIFGRVNEKDMQIVDSIVRGDKILSVKIVEGKSPRKKK